MNADQAGPIVPIYVADCEMSFPDDPERGPAVVPTYSYAPIATSQSRWLSGRVNDDQKGADTPTLFVSVPPAGVWRDGAIWYGESRFNAHRAVLCAKDNHRGFAFTDETTA